MYKLGIGILNLSADDYYNITFRELQYKIEAYAEKKDDEWDYTRHIMAAMGAGKGNPEKVIILSRDNDPKRLAAIRKEKEKDVERAKAFLNRMKG